MDTYRKGVAEREAGRCSTAAYYFLEALRENPSAGKAVKADAVTTVEYLPNLMLADCLCRMGDPEMARKYLAAAEASGEDRREAAAPMKESARRCLSIPAAPPPVEDRRERILEEVQEKCGLPDQADRTLYPWHYDYEVSQAFMREGMYDAGIQYLYRALDKKATPEEKTRLYGMWFTDYHPYFLLAKAFYHEGSTECALRALEHSIKTEDLKNSSEDLKERERIRKELEGFPPGR